MFVALARAAEHRVAEFNTCSLANTVWAFAKAGEPHPRLFEKVANHILALDDLSSFDGKGRSDMSHEALVRINEQSHDVVGGVLLGEDDVEVGAGDQGSMFGFASDETESQSVIGTPSDSRSEFDSATVARRPRTPDPSSP